MNGARGFDERAAIALLRESFGTLPAPAVELGIGDDAAVLRAQSSALVWTVDASIEGVHFDRRWLTLKDVGWRSFQAAVSDLAASALQRLADEPDVPDQ